MSQKKKMLKAIKRDFYRFTMMHEFDKEDNMDAERFTENLIEKIYSYQALLTPGTDEYEKAEMMKEYPYLQLAEWHKTTYKYTPEDRMTLKKDIKRVEKILERAEPLKMKKNGFMLYLDALTSLTFQNRLYENFKKSREYAQKAEAAFEAYRAANSEIPTHCSEFEGEVIFGREEFDMMKYQIGFVNRQSYEDDRDSCPVKYPIRAARWMLYLARKKFKGTLIPIHQDNFITYYNLIGTLVNRHCFKQVDHELAVLWSFTVKFRSQLPSDQRHLVNDPQGLISQLYARFAKQIWQVSLQSMIDQNVKFDNDTYEEINEPGDEHYKQYLGQFPIEPVKDFKALKKIYKKGLGWQQRALEMCPDPMKRIAIDRAYKVMNRVHESSFDKMEKKKQIVELNNILRRLDDCSMLENL